MGKVFSTRLLGLVFIGLLLLGVWLINALFTQQFVSFDKVTLRTDTIGLQLPSRADVKVRGVIVGEVLDAKSGANGAVLTLGIDPDKIGEIPKNVTASILPKTLFGEKYVELDVPAEASSKALAQGDLIAQTQLPIEVEKVLNDIYPLLRAVQPAELNYTLNALATALEGRGDAIGQNIETFDAYLKRLNPQVPALVEDLRLLSKVSGTYADVAPQIAETLRNTVKTGNTLVSREAKLHSFLQDVTSFSGTAKTFLDNNGSNIVRLGQLSKPQLELPAARSRRPGAEPRQHLPWLRVPHRPDHAAAPAPWLRPEGRARARRRQRSGLPRPAEAGHPLQGRTEPQRRREQPPAW
jgi:phospholipid/cholesterol/gamma-HCH transport system substrate-binding protein